MDRRVPIHTGSEVDIDRKVIISRGFDAYGIGGGRDFSFPDLFLYAPLKLRFRGTAVERCFTLRKSKTRSRAADRSVRSTRAAVVEAAFPSGGFSGDVASQCEPLNEGEHE